MLCLGSTLACSAVRKSSLASWTLPNLEWAMALLARICRTKTCLAISFFAVTEKLGNGLIFLGTIYTHASRIQHFFTCMYLLLGTWIIIVLTQTLNKLIATSALQYGHNVQCTCNLKPNAAYLMYIFTAWSPNNWTLTVYSLVIKGTITALTEHKSILNIQMLC